MALCASGSKVAAVRAHRSWWEGKRAMAYLFVVSFVCVCLALTWLDLFEGVFVFFVPVCLVKAKSLRSKATFG